MAFSNETNKNLILKINPYPNIATILNLISIIDCIIIIIGTIGNLCSCYILTRKRLRPVSSMRYLAALTLIDTICLYGWYLSSVYRQLNDEYLKLRLENLNSFSCKFIAYISFCSLQMSSIIILMITLDRLLIIKSEIWRSKFANPQFANKIIVIIGSLVLAFNFIIPLNLGNMNSVPIKIINYDGSKFTTTTTMSSSTLKNSNKNEYDLDESFSSLSTSYKAINYENLTACYCYNESNRIFKIWQILHLAIYRYFKNSIFKSDCPKFKPSFFFGSNSLVLPSYLLIELQHL